MDWKKSELHSKNQIPILGLGKFPLCNEVEMGVGGGKMLQRDWACMHVGLGWTSQSGVEALTTLRGQGVVKDRGPG